MVLNYYQKLNEKLVPAIALLNLHKREGGRREGGRDREIVKLGRHCCSEFYQIIRVGVCFGSLFLITNGTGKGYEGAFKYKKRLSNQYHTVSK